MPELLREPAELRRRIDRLEQDRPREGADDAHGEALAEGWFRLAVHHSTPVQEATGLLQRAAKIDGGNPKYPYHLGRIFLLHRRLDLASKWFGIASRLCPTSHRIWTHISLLQRELNEQYRTDQTVLQNDLRKRADKLVALVRDGADQVDESLLVLEPRTRTDAKGRNGGGGAVVGPEPSESGDGKATFTADVRRVQGAGRCRWSGVVDLQAEQTLEAAPSRTTAKRLLALLDELITTTRNRKGGTTGLAVLAIDWLVRGYPPSTIRHLIEGLQPSATDPSIELVATCCDLFELDVAELPARLAECVRANTVPPLLAAVIHQRRLLWEVPQLDRLGAVFRTAERFLDHADRAEGGDREPGDELGERARAATGLLDEVDRVERELERRPPKVLEEIVDEPGVPGSDAGEVQQRLRQLGHDAEELETQVGRDWQRLKDLKRKKESLDQDDVCDAAAIRERVESMLARCETVIEELEETKRSGAVESGEVTEELDAVKQAYIELKNNQGRFFSSLAKLRLPKKEERAAEVGDPAAAGEEAPTDPVELLAHKLRIIESKIRREFDRAEHTFAIYGDGARQSAPIRALHRSVRAGEAEALYRLGRRQEARRIWVNILREDPLDAGALKNVAVCDSDRGDLARPLQSWKSYIEILYYFDIVAGDPRPHARERAAFHRDFAGAYAPRCLVDDKTDPETAELASFLGSPRLAVFVGHKLLEILNDRLDYSSPPIILGVGRSARDDSRERARDNTHQFLGTISGLLPRRIGEAFCDVAHSHIDAAFEATASARRLTLKQDPYYEDEEKRYSKWLNRFVQFKLRLYHVIGKRVEALVDLSTLQWIEQLHMLDAVPIGNSPEFLKRFVADWEQYPKLMGRLGDAALTVAVNSGKHAEARHLVSRRVKADDCPKQLIQASLGCEVDAIETIRQDLGEDAFAEILDRWLERRTNGSASASDALPPDVQLAFGELDAVQRTFERVERRLDRAREALAGVEGEEIDLQAISEGLGDEDISAPEVEELGRQLGKTRVHVFLSPFYGRYKEIMARGEGGIETDSQAEEIAEQLERLRRSVAALEPLIGSDEDYRTLAEAIDKNLGALMDRRKMEREIKLVNELVARFKELMTSIEGPLSPAEGKRLRHEMRELKTRIAEGRGEVDGADGVKALDDLDTAIDRVLTQLEG